jgi:hypothetical protein
MKRLAVLFCSVFAASPCFAARIDPHIYASVFCSLRNQGSSHEYALNLAVRQSIDFSRSALPPDSAGVRPDTRAAVYQAYLTCPQFFQRTDGQKLI